MDTPYDWISIAIFAGLVVLFLQRSTLTTLRDSLWQYFPAALGCAVANWFGNNAHGRLLFHVAAFAVIMGTLAYIMIVLRPLDRPSE